MFGDWVLLIGAEVQKLRGVGGFEKWAEGFVKSGLAPAPTIDLIEEGSS